MAIFKCKMCGGELVEDGNWLVCDSCCSKYEAAPTVKTPPVQSTIALSDDVERLLQKCRTDRKNAHKYANLVLDIDPDNVEALKYL